MDIRLTPRILQWPLFSRNGCMQVLLTLLAKATEDGAIGTNREYIIELTRLSSITVGGVLKDLIREGVIEEDEMGLLRLTRLPDGILMAQATKTKTTHAVTKGKGATENTRFIKPTEEEVRAYIAQKGYHFTAEEFVAHYESNGWKVGRNPMKKWQAACVTFERMWKEKEERRNIYNHGTSNYQQQLLAARQLYAHTAAQGEITVSGNDTLRLPGM